MPNPLLVPSIISGASGFVSGIVDNIFARKNARDQFRNEVKLWNMQNEYNKPINQVARLREAGLNPALMYNNAAAGGSASSMHAPSINQTDPISKALDRITMLANLENIKANIDATNANRRKTEEDTRTAEIANSYATKFNDLNITKQTLDIGARKLALDFEKAAYMPKLNVVNLKSKEELAKLGILYTQSDNNIIKNKMLSEQLRILQSFGLKKAEAEYYSKVINNRAKSLLLPYQLEAMKLGNNLSSLKAGLAQNELGLFDLKQSILHNKNQNILLEGSNLRKRGGIIEKDLDNYFLKMFMGTISNVVGSAASSFLK